MASIVFKREHADKARRLLVELARTTRSEPGCIRVAAGHSRHRQDRLAC